MSKPLFRPKVGGKPWTRVRQIWAAGQERAYVTMSEGNRIEYSHRPNAAGTHALSLRAFLGCFAPPGQEQPLMSEFMPPRMED